jgi:hypothetical protein
MLQSVSDVNSQHLLHVALTTGLMMMVASTFSEVYIIMQSIVRGDAAWIVRLDDWNGKVCVPVSAISRKTSLFEMLKE